VPPAVRALSLPCEAKCAARNGARPESEVVTSLLGVRTGSAEAREMVCVLLLPGRAPKNPAGVGKPTPLEAPETGRARAGRLFAGFERTGGTLHEDAGRLVADDVSDVRRMPCRTRPKAHLTSGISSERSESAACRG